MMVRQHLHDLPSFDAPEPYRIRWYTEGDEDRWIALKAVSDMYHTAPDGFFEQIYGAHRDLLARRQAFLCDGQGAVIGTVTAWFEEMGGTRHGKVNWMLLAPQAQGAGLSKPLLSVCCARLAELGYTDAVLYTLTARVPALNLYRGFGFVPLIRHEEDLSAWESVRPIMKSPFTTADYVEMSTLEGSAEA
jgi:GNAT superfamily N-acetyltransferase